MYSVWWKDFSFYSLAGCLIMGNVWLAVILGSTRGMDSVIFATTHASNVQTKGLKNVPAVAKVNWVMTASHSRDKYRLLTFFLFCFCFHPDKFGVERYLFEEECRVSCPRGYFHSLKGTCDPCPSNCTVCTSTGHCLYCTPSYYPKDGMCAKLECGVGQLHHNCSRIFPIACLTFSIVSFLVIIKVLVTSFWYVRVFIIKILLQFFRKSYYWMNCRPSVKKTNVFVCFFCQHFSL